MKSQRLHGGQIAHRAVGDHPDTSQGLEDVRMHLAEEGAHARMPVDILDRQHPRRRDAEQILPPIVTHAGEARAKRVLHRRLGRADAQRKGVGDEGLRAGGQTADARIHEALVAHAYAGAFDGAGHGATVEPAKLFHDVARSTRPAGRSRVHSSSPSLMIFGLTLSPGL